MALRLLPLLSFHWETPLLPEITVLESAESSHTAKDSRDGVQKLEKTSVSLPPTVVGVAFEAVPETDHPAVFVQRLLEDESELR
jgi:hypothetical protein